jgi:S1-C subfamily serine protease
LGGGIIASNGSKKQKARGEVSFRSAEVKEIGRSLASLGLVRLNKGERLNVRRRESLRRALAEAGEPLRWSEVAALSDDPVNVAAGDVKKLVRSGAKSLERTVADELAEKKKEIRKLEKFVASLRKLAEDPKAEYPQEVTYTRSARGVGEGFVEKTETLVLNDAEEVAKAADKIERSLPNWTKVRDEVIAELKRKQETIESLKNSLSDLVEAWRGVLKEVLVTMP